MSQPAISTLHQTGQPGLRVLPLALRAPLIGREREREAVIALLSDPNTGMLTLTGPGGVGKTRLSLDVGSVLADADPSPFPDGVVFVDLAAISDVELILPTVARALDAQEQPGAGESVVDQLRQLLANRRLLLILDNLEQVVEVGPALAQLMTGCPGLRILGTSRRPLRVRSEREFPVTPLSTPDATGAETSDLVSAVGEIGRAPAVSLFVERARAVRPDFVLTPENAGAVAEICRHLDGLPLAIELAAARTRLLSPAALLAQLNNRLRILTGGARDLPERQQTMRAAVAWSHELLTPDEQALFRRLAVFSGGFSLDAAEAVARGQFDAASLTPDIDELDAVSALVDHSLVRPLEDESGEPRFGMLETIRAFGVERLAESGEEPAIRNNHAAWMLAFAERAEPELIRADQELWLNRVAIEHENARAALGWTLGRSDGATALALCGALWRFWNVRGYVSEGRSWLRQALEQSADAPKAIQAKALRAAGVLAELQREYAEAIRYDELALALWREIGDGAGAAASLSDLGNIASDTGEYDLAVERYRAALDFARRAGDRRIQGMALANLGNVAARQAQHDQAAEYYEASLAIMRPEGDLQRIAILLDNYGVVEKRRGDSAHATVLRAESLRIRQALGDRSGIASSMINLAEDEPDPRRAEAMFREALQISREVGFRENEAIALFNLANGAWARRDRRTTLEYFREALQIFHETANRLGVAETLEFIAYVLADVSPENAARALGAAERIRTELDSPVLADARPRHDQTHANLRRSLGPPRYEAAITAGRALDDAVAVAETDADALIHTFSDSPVSTAPTPLTPPAAPLTESAWIGTDPHGLTPRELQVLALLASAKSDREIAEELSISPKTAGNHVTNILGKLGVDSRTAAAAYAIRTGLA